jgi:DNA (cytosine-5)-methyltransferase 1
VIRNYYNDNDPKACAWIRELIAAGEIPPGDVDCRSIMEVRANELKRYDQCHFFAGISGWPLALRWAGLEGGTGIWTASCPCQPFSSAGQRKGVEDDRHLWPVFYELVRRCRPSLVFGEQVASADVIGSTARRSKREAGKGPVWFDGISGDLEAAHYAVGAAIIPAGAVGAPHRRQRLFWVGHSESMHREIPVRRRGPEQACAELGRAGRVGGTGFDFWSRYDLLPCRDGKARRIESGTFPLAHGIPGRVGLLRGYGNAIVPQVATRFITVAIDSIRHISSRIPQA